MMNPPVQAAIGIGLGYLISRVVIPQHAPYIVPNRRKKKFVRVRGHMRSMPKKCKCEKPSVIEKVVEKVNEVVSSPSWSKDERPESVKLKVPDTIALAENEVGTEEQTVPSVPSAIARSARASRAASEDCDWPTMADVTRPEDESGFAMADIPWRTIIIVGGIAGGLALIGSYMHQQQAQQTPEVTP